KASLQGKDVALGTDSASLRKSFSAYGKRDRVLRSLEYLDLAKQVEPIAMRRASASWEQQSRSTPVDVDHAKELINAAEARIAKVDKFLAERYRFQVMRLLFYTEQFSDAQKYFGRYKGVFNQENSPKYRFMQLAAGAYYKEKKYGPANYLFSQVFDKFP